MICVLLCGIKRYSRGLRDVWIVIRNQRGNNLSDARAADLPQRIKGRNANVVEFVFLDHSLESFDAFLVPVATQRTRAEVAHPNIVSYEPLNQSLNDLRRVHVAERASRSRTHIRCLFFQRTGENI